MVGRRNKNEVPDHEMLKNNQTQAKNDTKCSKTIRRGAKVDVSNAKILKNGQTQGQKWGSRQPNVNKSIRRRAKMMGRHAKKQKTIRRSAKNGAPDQEM